MLFNVKLKYYAIWIHSGCHGSEEGANQHGLKPQAGQLSLQWLQPAAMESIHCHCKELLPW